MDRGVKIVIVSGVLLVGIAAATLFRRSSPPARPPEPDSNDHLMLRHQSGPQEAEPSPSVPNRPTAEIEPSATASDPPRASGRAPGSLAPMDRGEPPPGLARSYPHLQQKTTSSRSPATPLGLGRAEPSGTSGSPIRVQTHRIVDGDTLRALADRYLGDADRYLEIYEANRDQLPSPEVLPIGVELNIPARRKRAPSSPSRVPERPLVPVPPASSRPGDPES